MGDFVVACCALPSLPSSVSTASTGNQLVSQRRCELWPPCAFCASRPRWSPPTAQWPSTVVELEVLGLRVCCWSSTPSALAVAALSCTRSARYRWSQSPWLLAGCSSQRRRCEYMQPEPAEGVLHLLDSRRASTSSSVAMLGHHARYGDQCDLLAQKAQGSHSSQPRSEWRCYPLSRAWKVCVAGRGMIKIENLFLYARAPARAVSTLSRLCSPVIFTRADGLR